MKFSIYLNKCVLKIWLVGVKVGGGAYKAMQTTMLHMKSLNEIETPSFFLLYVLCFQGQLLQILLV